MWYFDAKEGEALKAEVAALKAEVVALKVLLNEGEALKAEVVALKALLNEEESGETVPVLVPVAPILDAFWDAWVDDSDPEALTPCNKLYKAAQDWCEGGAYKMSNGDFAAFLKRKGVRPAERLRVRGGRGRYYVGVKIKPGFQNYD